MGFPRREVLWILLVIGLMETYRCQTTVADDCGRLDGCGDCISGDSLNLTGCVWRQCDDDTISGCVTSGDTIDGCSMFNDTTMCPAPATSTPSNSVSDTTVQPTVVYSQARFNLSSFIGGIILVLCLQAGGFFAMKFMKAKDSSYETIEQVQ
ncbi:CD164 sialomucin-like 2 protein [Paramormyrops kingsleyae]|uniref:CD164 sialomucin-like 2 protein n=1 Tax=Paramormyrops kingsleyae TaxID=1676925 RepID=UPI003B97598E